MAQSLDRIDEFDICGHPIGGVKKWQCRRSPTTAPAVGAVRRC
jgi:hypothetical protein